MIESHDHHVVPQFVLRNFARDAEHYKATTLAKDGDFAVWMERSIKGIGYEKDFYVHMVHGRPVSVETTINKRIETPISQSDTWTKIASGRSDALDFSDRPILYALVRHLEARTPHYFQTGEELAALAADPASHIPFTSEEREMYANLRANPDLAKVMFNMMSTHQFAPEYDRCLILVRRSSVPLRSSTTPVLAAPFPEIPGIDLTLPGMVPFQRLMTIDPFTTVSVVVGDFGGAFVNYEMSLDDSRLHNRMILAQYAKFPEVRHLICDREKLVYDMNWARYDLIRDSAQRIIFKRRTI